MVLVVLGLEEVGVVDVVVDSRLSLVVGAVVVASLSAVVAVVRVVALAVAIVVEVVADGVVLDLVASATASLLLVVAYAGAVSFALGKQDLSAWARKRS